MTLLESLHNFGKNNAVANAVGEPKGYSSLGQFGSEQATLNHASNKYKTYGVDTRLPFPSEDAYFKGNPHVGGMAADDDKVILNPYSTLNDKERQAVVMNESARVYMRNGSVEKPAYSLSDDQGKAFLNYGNGNVDAQRQTIAARILSNDPSSLNPTLNQLAYVQRLKSFMQERQ